MLAVEANTQTETTRAETATPDTSASEKQQQTDQRTLPKVDIHVPKVSTVQAERIQP